MRGGTVAALAVLLAAASCTDPEPDSSHATTVPEETSRTSPSTPVSDRERVLDAADLHGFWVPIEVNGEPVPTDLGAFWSIHGEGERIAIEGHDGCNGFTVRATDSEAPPVGLVDGKLTPVVAMQQLVDCGPNSSIDARPTTGSTFVLDDAQDELLVAPIERGRSTRLRRVDEAPIDPQAQEAIERSEAEQAAQEAQERAEREAAEAAALENRARIERELPDARLRWTESGTTDYTMRFEVGALRVDPSFPQRRPVGGVWEIVVIDGVALDNEWADSILGDTVDDWFDYVESQLDSHYLHVEFDPERGFPTVIDSQPLGEEDVSDTNEIVAWLVRTEIGPPVPADRDPDAPEPGLVRLDDLEPLADAFWDPDTVDGRPAAFLDHVYWTISHDISMGAVTISGFDGRNQWDLAAASDPSTPPRLDDGVLTDVGVPPEAGDCPPGKGVLTSYPIEGAEFWYDPFGNRLVITPTTAGVSIGFRRLIERPEPTASG